MVFKIDLFGKRCIVKKKKTLKIEVIDMSSCIFLSVVGAINVSKTRFMHVRVLDRVGQGYPISRL